MDSKKKEDKQNKDSTSERINNLSEDKRKLLDAMMDEKLAKQTSSTSQKQQRVKPSKDSRQNPGAKQEGAPQYSEDTSSRNTYGNQGQHDPWMTFWQNAFQNRTGPGEGTQHNPWSAYGQSGFQDQPDQERNHPGSPPSPPRSPLVAMKPSGSRPPFFCVHAILGSVFPYHNLALHMDETQPFYGLQASGLDGKQPPLKKIEEMATLYLKLIHEVQPKGPYYLGGYSFGGWVAFEMAQQLAKKEEKVKLLAIFGTMVPYPSMDSALVEQMEFLLQYLEDFQKLVTNSFLSDQHRMAMGDNQAVQAPSPLYQVFEANGRAQLLYAPHPCPSKITLFVTKELKDASASDPSMGWRMLSVEDVETHLVLGNHLNTFQEPYVRDLAEKLTFCLNKAQEGDSGR